MNFQNNNDGAWDMTQWVRALLHMHKCLSFDLSSMDKAVRDCVSIYNPRA